MQNLEKANFPMSYSRIEAYSLVLELVTLGLTAKSLITLITLITLIANETAWKIAID